MWKSGSDSDEDQDSPLPGRDQASKPASKSSGGAPSKASSKPKPSDGKAKKPKAKVFPDGDEKGEKKLLVEETPSFDTYESRRRVRIMMGGVTVACILLVCWICYRTFVYDPNPIDMAAAGSGDPSGPQPIGAAPKPSLDREAQVLYRRAQELNKNGRADQAIAMLNKVVKVYKDTPTANEAKAALDRSEKNLPLFATGPIVVAEPEKAAPAPRAPPPRVVVDAVPSGGKPTKGEAALVLPANPAESVVVAPPNANPPGPRGPQPRLGPCHQVFRPIFKPGFTHPAGHS